MRLRRDWIVSAGLAWAVVAVWLVVEWVVAGR